MKKIFILIILILSLLLTNGTYAGCDVGVDDVEKIGDALNTCLGDSNLIDGSDATVETGLKDLINKIVKSLGTILGVFAVASIVYGSLQMTLSAGDDEKIKKAKDIVKWGIIGFLGVIFASSIILLVVNIMYGFGS